MGMTCLKDHLCEYCIANLLDKESELLADFFIDLMCYYLKGVSIIVDPTYCAGNSLVKRLEKIGYLTSTEINQTLAIARPTGIEIANGCATICANRKEHDALNYAL
jgi:hypothetical protein